MLALSLRLPWSIDGVWAAIGNPVCPEIPGNPGGTLLTRHPPPPRPHARLTQVEAVTKTEYVDKFDWKVRGWRVLPDGVMVCACPVTPYMPNACMWVVFCPTPPHLCASHRVLGGVTHMAKEVKNSKPALVLHPTLLTCPPPAPCQVENENKPVWTRNPKEVDEQTYNDFFKSTFGKQGGGGWSWSRAGPLCHA